MKKIRLLFVIVVMGLFFIPWFDLGGPRIYGVEHEAPQPDFSWKRFVRGEFQKQTEKWWNRTFGARRTMLVIKNDLYEVLNLGQFHSGYGGNVLQGQHGILFEKAYVTSKFSPLSPEVVDSTATETVAVLKKLNEKLKYLDKEMIFIMAPSKEDAREEALPGLWKFRAQYIPQKFDAHDIWEKHFHDAGIAHINAMSLLREKNVLRESFPDTGTHWTLYASGLVWEHIAKYLHEKNSFFPPIEVSGMEKTFKAHAEERDIANLLNIRPRYRKGNKEFPTLEYKPISSEKAVPITLLGDSFCYQLHKNILQSGFSNHETFHLYFNWLPDQETWHALLSETRSVLFCYTYPKLFSNRIKNEVEELLSHMDHVILENWHDTKPEEAGRWSKDASSIKFLKTEYGDYTLSFVVKDAFFSKRIKLSLNGRPLKDILLSDKKVPVSYSVPLPEHMLKKGENRIQLTIEGAAMPIHVLKNSKDERLLGILCTDMNVRHGTYSLSK